MNTSHAYGAGLLALVALFVLIWSLNGSDSPREGENLVADACTKEAQICADGSSVYRTGTNCEFAACKEGSKPSKPTSSPTSVPTTQTPSNASKVSVIARYNETVTVLGVSITPLLILEDSRCPSDAQCVSAGNITLQTRIQSVATTTDQFLEIGKAYTTATEIITLTAVSPQPKINQPIGSTLYRFTFEVKKK